MAFRINAIRISIAFQWDLIFHHCTHLCLKSISSISFTFQIFFLFDVDVIAITAFENGANRCTRYLNGIVEKSLHIYENDRAEE